MELHLLRVFHAIAAEGSITKAANRLNYVQSNLSARLKQLEDELQCTLFSRTRRGMFLTEHGDRLLPYAREMLQREREIFRDMQTMSSSGDLTLGAPDSFVRTYLAAPLGKWIADHPQSKVRVKTGFSYQVVQYLESQAIDIGVVAAKKRPTNLHVIRRIPDELCVVTPREIKKLGTSDLNRLQPMILGDACFFGQATLQLFNERGLVSERQENLFSIETILQCIALGFGASVFPRRLMAEHPMRNEVATHPFPGKKSFSYYKVCLQSRSQSLLVRALGEYF